LSKAGNIDANGFSIEIALKPATDHKNRFNFLFAIHNGNDGKQLVIGQYRSSLIVMNGDDYDHSRKIKRVSAKLNEDLSTPQFLTLTTGKNGTSIYLNGRLIQAQRDLTLKIPEGENARLLLGNSVYGKNSWKGDVLCLAIYPYTLSEQDASEHFKQWIRDGKLLFAKEYNPKILYLFNEKKGETVMDHGDGHFDLYIPAKMKILQKTILAFPWNRLKFNTEFFEDVMINLIGFIPLGFFLNITFAKVSSDFERHGVLITVVLCFFISLFIEVFQAWIPSRSSDVLDLVLNTAGGLLGAMMMKVQGSRLKVQGKR
jgi:hypothetical protein